MTKEDFKAKLCGVWSSACENNEELLFDTELSNAEKAIKRLQLKEKAIKRLQLNEKVKIIKPMSIEDKAIQYTMLKVGEQIIDQKMKEIKEMDEKVKNGAYFYSSDNFFEELRKTYYSQNFKRSHGMTVDLPEIIDVEVINDCVTIVTVSDGTKEKAVLDKADTFNLEQGISICITKKLLAQITGFGGTKVYNGLIKRAIKKHKAKLDSIEKSKQIEQQNKKKYDKIAAKKAKRKAAQREARINEQAEAYRRALQSMNTSNSAE